MPRSKPSLRLASLGSLVVLVSLGRVAMANVVCWGELGGALRGCKKGDCAGAGRPGAECWVGAVGVWWEGPAAANAVCQRYLFGTQCCAQLSGEVWRARRAAAVAAWAAPCCILAQFKLRPSFCTSQRGCRARAVDTFPPRRPTPSQPASPPDGEPSAQPCSGSAAVPAFTQCLLRTV